jgi:hypothetical protein
MASHDTTCAVEGRYKGVPYGRVPVQYLRWVVREKPRGWEVAKAELDRRGDDLRDGLVDISMHAINRASVRFLNKYRKDRQTDEGIVQWLSRVVEAGVRARMKGGKRPPGHEEQWELYDGNMCLVVKFIHNTPILVTVK